MTSAGRRAITALSRPWPGPSARKFITNALAGVLLLSAAGWCGTVQAAAPAILVDIDLQAEDHPAAARVNVQKRLALAQASGDVAAEFWLRLAEARVLGLMEDGNAASSSLQAAADALARLPPPQTLPALWLELENISVDANVQDPRVLAQRMAALRPRIAALGDAALSCEFTGTDLWLLQDADSYDEAWQAAEALERCGREGGNMLAVADARTALATLSSVLQPVGGAATAAGHLQRALQVLGTAPLRYRRSVIEWEFGLMLRRALKPAEGMPHLRSALARSREIDDKAGIAAAQIGIAQVLLDLHRPVEALPPLKEAQAALQGTDDGFRMISLEAMRVRALAALKRPEVLAEIEHARQWDRTLAQPGTRADLARAMADGYAAVGHHAQAYAEMLRAEELVKAGRANARDGQVLRLQARYDVSRRDAENAELRHRGEAALLQLQAQAARQRSLWAALLALAALLAMVAYFGARTMARRRTLADLALRDELTGQPNRRAVAAYAQAQFEQTRRLGDSLGVPLALAMIDLDHFKSVNDRWGHAVGDAALRAFASAASSVLRGQDRLGRWGGEEWLLVMPGTSTAELPLVFERLRSRYAATPVEGIEGEHGLTFSMGGAELRAGMPNLEALIAEADRELFRAKREGRNALRHAA